MYMSAPKRTSAPNPSSLPWGGRKQWQAAFLKSVRQDGTARRAWEMISRAGLETPAIRVLWTYAHPPTDHVKTAQRNAKRISRRIKALNRASKISKDRHTAGDPRVGLFFGRALDRYGDIVHSGMPFMDGGATVGDWAISRVAAGKGLPDLAASQKAFVSLGPRSPISDRKFWLFVLRCYAANAGVPLGFERLTALAHCADPNSELDPRTLARFLASIPTNFMAKCLRDFNNHSTPELFPPQN